MAALQRKALFFVSEVIPVAIVVLFGLASLSEAEVTLDGSLGGSIGPVTGPAYQIPDSFGLRAGNNLFHSFGKFNLATGESAIFTNTGDPLANVIARVTGGVSNIDGLIQSTIAGANLFLLNPAGVMFGPNASLDVQGSFHVSTADYLRFNNGDTFFANPSAASVLSIASPEAFGFLGSSPSGISLDRSVLQVPAEQTISIVAGSITAQNDPTAANYFDYVNSSYGSNFYLLNAPGGKINLVSVASPGLVNINQPDVSSFTQLGTIDFTNGANISVASDTSASGPAGSIFIRGGNILFKDIGIVGVTAGIEASGSPAGLVDIRGGTLQLDNASIGLFNTGETSLGKIASINVSGDFLMTNGAYIDSTNYGWGNAGAIEITADRVRLGDNDPTTSLYASQGFYGYLSSHTQYGATGRGGDISITARDITLQNGFLVNTASMQDDGYGAGIGDAGNITVHADTLQIKDKGQISSDAYGQGNGGIVSIVARDLQISDTNRTLVANTALLSGIAANTQTSSGGKILVNAETVQLKDGGIISTVLWGSGTGADVTITAKNMTVSGFVADSTLGAKPYGLTAVDGRVFGAAASGQGGNIVVTADSLKLENGGTIRTGLYSDAPGNAGSITVNAKTIDIASRGQIYADSFRGTGNSGDLTVNAATMTITGANNVPRPEPLDFDFTGLSTTTNAGSGGKITVALTGNLTASEGGGIKADTRGTGSGGAIDISARNVNVSDTGTAINALSVGSGNAGNIYITAADSVYIRDSSITTEALLADGGNINIKAPGTIRLDNSTLTASVNGEKETYGGNIVIDPQYVILKGSDVIATAHKGTGGNISITANVFLADATSLVSAASELGFPGTVNIDAPNNITGLIAPLSSDFTSASSLLRERCIARIREGKYSSFVVGGRGGMPIEPGNMLPGVFP